MTFLFGKSGTVAGGALAVFFFGFRQTPAAAHHAVGYETPGTLAEGFMSGLAHPVIGPDHLAFILAMGLLALLSPHRILLPLVFVLAGAAGVMVHGSMGVGGFLPAAEVGIGLSIVVAGIFLVWSKALSLIVSAFLFALAGICHGYAFGAAVIGAEPTPVVAYLVGLALVQWGVAVGVQEGVRLFSGVVPAPDSRWFRTGGGMAMGAGLVFLGQMLPV